MRAGFLLVFLAVAPAAAAADKLGSTVAIDPLGRGTWIIDQERDEVTLIAEDGELRSFSAAAWPEQLVVRSDGTVFISCRGAGRVQVIDPGMQIKSVAVGAEPRSIALSESEDRLYVGLITERAIVALSASSLELVARREVGVPPQSMALTSAGVAYAAPKAGAVSFISRALAGEEYSVALIAPKGSKREPWHVQGLVPMDDGHLLVLHALVDTGLGMVASSGGYGGGVFQPIAMGGSLISLNSSSVPSFKQFAGALEIQDAQGAAISGNMLFVASRATKQLVIAAIDPAKLVFSPVEARNLGEGVTGVAIAPDGTAHTLVAFERRLAKVTLHPKAEKTLWSAEHLENGGNSFALGFCEGTPPFKSVKKVALGTGSGDAELALGRSLFHDGVSEKLSSGTACVTCHPDGREDGLVWRLKGMRRQTPMLSDRVAGTAPFNWEGNTKTLEKNIEQTVERIGGFGLTWKEQRALARFLVEGLRPVHRPAPRDASLVARGEELFNQVEVGCARCHPAAQSFADGEQYDVESTGAVELAEMKRALAPLVRRPQIRKFPFGVRRQQALSQPKIKVKAPEYDVPSLRHLALTAPYFHDGSVDTLEELIDQNADRMGNTSALGPDDRRALVAYLRSL